MATEQVHSFIGKFFSLWANGNDVSLQLKLLDGKCKVIMELDVGDYVYTQNAPDSTILRPKPSVGLSRQRCREYLHKDRIKSADELENVVKSDQQVPLSAENADSVSCNVNSENTDTCIIDIGKTVDGLYLKKPEIDEHILTEKVGEDDSTFKVSNVEVEEATESNMSEIKNCLVTSHDLGMTVDSLDGPSDIIIMHAQVNYNLCPVCSLMEDNINALD